MTNAFDFSAAPAAGEAATANQPKNLPNTGGTTLPWLALILLALGLLSLGARMRRSNQRRR